MTEIYLIIKSRAKEAILLAGLLFISILSHGQCTASFTMINNGNGNFTFSNTSTGTASTTTFSWSFPGGSPAFSSNSTSVSVTYTNNGAFSASLTMSTSSPSCTSQTQTTFTVTGLCNMNPGFTYTPGPNGQVSFSSTATGATGYTWVPGLATGPTFTTTFPNNGSYQVTLFVTNGFCLDSITDTIVVNSICTLSANATYTLGAGGQVQFQNTSTGTTSPTTYTWSFGNGNTSTQVSPTHTYALNGSYIVTLTAVNNTLSGCASSYTFMVVISNVICHASFVYSVLPNGVVTFSSTSQPASGTSVYSWNFSGSSYTSVGTPTAITAYSVNGSYPVTLNFASGSCFTSITDTIVVNSIIPCLLFADFTFSVGQSGVVTFTNLTGGTTTATSYTWNFGDTYTSTAVSPTHTYSGNGLYQVNLTASNDSSGNCKSDTTLTVFVSSYSCALVASFAHTVGSNGAVTFSNTSTGTHTAQTCNWNFGDGYSGTGAVITHTYQNGGTHFVSLSVTSSVTGFCADTAVQALNITGVNCVANANFTLGPTSTPQYWVATPVYPWNVATATWAWGDGSQSNALYASHTYSAPGQYNICLTVTATCGSTATACASYSVYRSSGTLVHVNVQPPALMALPDAPQLTQLLVFPVPCNQVVTLSWEIPFNESAVITITDLLGRTIITRQTETGDTQAQMDISMLPEGVYVLHLTNSVNRRSAKFIVER